MSSSQPMETSSSPGFNGQNGSTPGGTDLRRPRTCSLTLTLRTKCSRRPCQTPAAAAIATAKETQPAPSKRAGSDSSP